MKKIEDVYKETNRDSHLYPNMKFRMKSSIKNIY